MPAAAAAEVLALLVEWALNISLFTPALPRRVFSHLAMVAELIGLCGLVTLRNNEVWLPLSVLV